MRLPPLTAVVVALGALVAAGCGGSGGHATASATRSTSTSSGGQATLEQAVRRAVSQDHALLTQALTTNHVPPGAEGTAGPALAALRRSAAQRQAQGVSVRILSEKFSVTAIQLDPSYTTASVTVLNTQRVLPSYGHRQGSPSTSHEHVRLVLHRVGDADRFVVWQVVPVG